MKMRENPFPGMNPYMENPHLWHGHHALFINYINAELNLNLPEEYATRIEERVYVEDTEKEYIPDDVVVQTASVFDTGARNRRNEGGVAVLARPAFAATMPFDEPLLLGKHTRTTRERFLEIRTRDEAADLIAVIEVVSPTNKKVGEGRSEYQRKQRNVLRSGAHLLEIDLLRDGTWVLAPSENQLRRRASHFDYAVSLHRGGSDVFEVWPVALQNHLPRLRLPLTDEPAETGAFVPLDLQTVVNRAYQEGGVWRNMRYGVPPDPPLGGEAALWADALLQEKGLRRAA